MMAPADPLGRHVLQEKGTVTKKEIVKQIADEIEETQLKTKEIVQLTFDAIVDTLITDRRIELRNFGVFEVKLRKARKARNPRTDAPVEVPPKNVVTFKPGKEMEERVRKLTDVPDLIEEDDTTEGESEGNSHLPEARATTGAGHASDGEASEEDGIGMRTKARKPRP